MKMENMPLTYTFKYGHIAIGVFRENIAFGGKFVVNIYFHSRLSIPSNIGSYKQL